MISPNFVWVQDNAPLRNQFVAFEQTFDIGVLPELFDLHLFADTRYRLRVNGRFVAVGPGRFVTQFPEYDTHDLKPLLQTGMNTVTVEVNFFGASSFQSMPDGQPGFIAWGGDGAVDLATPGNWQAFRLNAWRWDAPLFSFAQGPVEICDTRISALGTPCELVVIEGEAAPWGALTPYSGAPIPYFVHYPKSIELAASLKNGEKRIGFMSYAPHATWSDEDQSTRPSRAFATWILSPIAQTVRLSCFWSTLYCNGVEVTVDTETPYGNHGYCTLNLMEGWNLLTGVCVVLKEFWPYCLGVPNGFGLSLHGECNEWCAAPLALSPVAHNLILPTPSATSVPAGWALHDGDPLQITPARMMAWDVPADDAIRQLPLGRLAEVSTIEAASATWCFSFAGEFLGHIVLEVEAPEGTILDVATDDWQAAHGGVALYQSNPFTDAADRFILRGGRQRVEMYHPRGGKLLQASLRTPGGKHALSLHNIFVRSRQTSAIDETHFSCGQPDLDWVWPVALRTVIASTDEAYSDCPWRERGSYIGDVHVSISIDLLFNRDHRTARRALRIFGQAQLPDGQLACCAPAWLRRPHEDFTLIWILAIHQYWTLTGDHLLLKEAWPAIRRIWESKSWAIHSSGLWNTTGKRLFIDWGVIQTEREGEANATINILRFAAARACAQMANAAGHRDEVHLYSQDAESVQAALCDLVWNDTEGRFNASLEATTSAVHANILALAFNIGSLELRSRILRYLEPRLRGNLDRGIREAKFSGHLELYFLHYALPALAENGRPDLAELLIEQHYGFLRGIGDDTLPENFCRVEHSVGSRCHSWSGAGAIYAARYILGLRPAEPGNPNKLIFAPVVHGIKGASGRIAHPKGWIEVDWETQNGCIAVNFSSPECVEILDLSGDARTRSHFIGACLSTPGKVKRA